MFSQRVIVFAHLFELNLHVIVVAPLIFTLLWLTPNSEAQVRFCLRSTALCSFTLFVPAFLSAAAPKLFKNEFGKKWRSVGIYFFWGLIASHTVHLSNIIYLIEVYYHGDGSTISNYFTKVGIVLLYVLFLFSLKPFRRLTGDKLAAEYGNFCVYFIMLVFTFGLFDITTRSFNLVQFTLWIFAWSLIVIRGLTMVGVDNEKVREDDQAVLPW